MEERNVFTPYSTRAVSRNLREGSPTTPEVTTHPTQNSSRYLAPSVNTKRSTGQKKKPNGKSSTRHDPTDSLPTRALSKSKERKYDKYKFKEDFTMPIYTSSSSRRKKRRRPELEKEKRNVPAPAENSNKCNPTHFYSFIRPDKNRKNASEKYTQYVVPFPIFMAAHIAEEKDKDQGSVNDNIQKDCWKRKTTQHTVSELNSRSPEELESPFRMLSTVNEESSVALSGSPCPRSVSRPESTPQRHDVRYHVNTEDNIRPHDKSPNINDEWYDTSNATEGNRVAIEDTNENISRAKSCEKTPPQAKIQHRDTGRTTPLPVIMLSKYHTERIQTAEQSKLSPVHTVANRQRQTTARESFTQTDKYLPRHSRPPSNISVIVNNFPGQHPSSYVGETGYYSSALANRPYGSYYRITSPDRSPTLYSLEEAYSSDNDSAYSDYCPRDDRVAYDSYLKPSPDEEVPIYDVTQRSLPKMELPANNYQRYLTEETLLRPPERTLKQVSEARMEPIPPCPPKIQIGNYCEIHRTEDTLQVNSVAHQD